MSAQKWKTGDAYAALPEEVTYNFAVLIGSKQIGGFTEISGLERSIEVETLQEGGRNHAPHQLFNGGSWGSLTLKGGSVHSALMWDWINSVNESAKPLSGSGSAGKSAFPKGNGFRREVMVVHLTRDRTPARVYHLHRCFPKRWKGADLNAGQSASPVEELELVFESLLPQVLEYGG